MIKKISKILIFLLVISSIVPTLSTSVKAYNDIPESADTTEIQKYVYTRMNEINYLSEKLRSANINEYTISDIVSYLDQNGYFNMAPVRKKAFLNSAAKNKKLYFRSQISLAIQAENSNNWNIGVDRYLDYSPTACFSSTLKQNGQDAAKFFLGNYCQLNQGSASNIDSPNFYDKTKWQSSQLDKLYSTYWPDLANQRYRPVFTPQEKTNLRAVVQFISNSAYVKGNKTKVDLGTFCDKITDTGLVSDDGSLLLLLAPFTALFRTTSIVSKPALTAEQIAAKNGLTVAEQARLIKEELGMMATTYSDEFIVNTFSEILGKYSIQEVNLVSFMERWNQAELSLDKSLVLDQKLKAAFIRVGTKGRIVLFTSEEEASFFYEHYVRIVPMDNDFAGLAPYVSDGKIISPMKIRVDVLEYLERGDIGNVDDVLSHEIAHYAQMRATSRLATRATVSEGVASQLTARGMTLHAPLYEALNDYFNFFNTGKISYSKMPGKYAFGYPKEYLETADALVRKIMIRRKMTYDQAVYYLYRQYVVDDYSLVNSQVFKGYSGWFDRINTYLAKGDYKGAKNYIKRF